MRPYEVMVIFDTDYEGPAIQAVVDKALATISDTGGTPGTIDRWGKRPFCYEVKHRNEGYYIVMEFAGENQTVNDLDRLLGLAEEVLRHRIIRRPEGLAPSQGSKRPPAEKAAVKRPRKKAPTPRAEVAPNPPPEVAEVIAVGAETPAE